MVFDTVQKICLKNVQKVHTETPATEDIFSNVSGSLKGNYFAGVFL